MNEFSLLHRLRYLYDKQKQALSHVFKTPDSDLKKIRDIRNYLTHYPSDRNLAWSDRDILRFARKMQVMLEAHLLSEIGLSNGQIETLITHSQSDFGIAAYED